MVKILVTGGAGFVGSHTVVLLLQKGFDVVVVDNSINSIAVATGASKPESLLRVEQLAGKTLDFEFGDIRDESRLRGIFSKHGPIDAVIHFGGLKSVGESVRSPLKYYDNNVWGTINLGKIMEENNCKRIIFSSSSTVYGPPKYLPLDEDHPTGATASPYGRTKYIVEQLFHDLCASDPIFGDDYETPDGSCVRGYVHVMDVGAGHVTALEKLLPPKTVELEPGPIPKEWKGVRAFNLGMGQGTSAFQILDTFKKVTGLLIPHKVEGRRAGDVPATFANCDKAGKEMSWIAKESLETMCMDSWRFQLNNPNGYLPGANNGNGEIESGKKMNGKGCSVEDRRHIFNER